MQGLILGIDLCDDYSQISCYNPLTKAPEAIALAADESSCLIPTVICKKRGEDIWFIGEEAYRRALFNEGTMVDKLVKLAGKNGSATIEGTKYSAEDLLTRYVKRLLNLAQEKYQMQEVDSLVFTLQSLTNELPELLVRVAESCGVPGRGVHLLSHTESFVYHTVNQRQDLWANIACMYDLTDSGLHYYEMRMVRGRNPRVVEAAHERMDESFSLSLLDNSTGQKMADTILAACAERLAQRKPLSSVMLTGKGFTKTDWMPSFLKVITRCRKVFAGQHVFSDGAAYVAWDMLQERSAYHFTCLCEGRIRSEVSVDVIYGGRREKIVLAEAGTNWFDAQARVELIPDHTRTLELKIIPADGREGRVEEIDLSEFPERPNKTTRLELILSFTSEDCMTVRVLDRGFGEIFPSSGKMIRREIYLSQEGLL